MNSQNSYKFRYLVPGACKSTSAANIACDVRAGGLADAVAALDELAAAIKAGEGMWHLVSDFGSLKNSR